MELLLLFFWDNITNIILQAGFSTWKFTDHIRLEVLNDKNQWISRDFFPS